jgi:hypothetical protein
VLPAAGSRYDARRPGEPRHAALGPRRLKRTGTKNWHRLPRPRSQWPRKAPICLAAPRLWLCARQDWRRFATPSRGVPRGSPKAVLPLETNWFESRSSSLRTA